MGLVLSALVDALELEFKDYLTSWCSNESQRSLADALDRCQLGMAAGLLRSYRRGYRHNEIVCPYEPWAGRRCLIGPDAPPTDCDFGTLWFDTLELALMVLVPNRPHVSTDSIAWLRIEPVPVWQFRVFLRLARVGSDLYPFELPADYLRGERFERLHGLEPVTNVYNDEAYGYCHWFGKQLLDDGGLGNADVFLPRAMMDRLWPPGLSVWDPSGSFDELRLAHARLSDPVPEEAVHVSEDLEERIRTFMLDEWYRGQIGFSTCWTAKYDTRRFEGCQSVCVAFANSAMNVR